MNFLKIILFPFAVLYGCILFFRNKLYDWNILSSYEFEIPVISVGNLVTGGTGKTPHVEYLIRLLREKYTVATLSRGYGRASSGFILAGDAPASTEIGDEPKQFKNKFRDILVSVDNKRVRGIKKLMALENHPEVILLDDAFQHRSVAPGISILLTDYNHLFYNDRVLPAGCLREFKSGAKRADVIIVTKTPGSFSPLERRRLLKEINPRAYQKVYFSYIKYGGFTSLTGKAPSASLLKEFYFEKDYTILLMTGIANADPLERYLRSNVKNVMRLNFSDHHEYNMAELMNVKEKFNSIEAKNKIILTTEKDAMRLEAPGNTALLKDLPVFYISIEVDFHDKDKEDFDRKILDYVKGNFIKETPEKLSKR